jgi:hypothetical protein
MFYSSQNSHLLPRRPISPLRVGSQREAKIEELCTRGNEIIESRWPDNEDDGRASQRWSSGSVGPTRGAEL